MSSSTSTREEALRMATQLLVGGDQEALQKEFIDKSLELEGEESPMSDSSDMQTIENAAGRLTQAIINSGSFDLDTLTHEMESSGLIEGARILAKALN